MIKLNVHEAKTHLSRYLERVEKGETILLCRRNVPVAEIHPLPAARKRKPRIGPPTGKIHIPDSFYEPLPAKILAAFYGGELPEKKPKK